MTPPRAFKQKVDLLQPGAAEVTTEAATTTVTVKIRGFPESIRINSAKVERGAGKEWYVRLDYVNTGADMLCLITYKDAATGAVHGRESFEISAKSTGAGLRSEGVNVADSLIDLVELTWSGG